MQLLVSQLYQYMLSHLWWLVHRTSGFLVPIIFSIPPTTNTAEGEGQHHMDTTDTTATNHHHENDLQDDKEEEEEEDEERCHITSIGQYHQDLQQQIGQQLSCLYFKLFHIIVLFRSSTILSEQEETKAHMLHTLFGKNEQQQTNLQNMVCMCILSSFLCILSELCYYYYYYSYFLSILIEWCALHINMVLLYFN
jgi:hypothetical protein